MAAQLLAGLAVVLRVVGFPHAAKTSPHREVDWPHRVARHLQGRSASRSPWDMRVGTGATHRAQRIAERCGDVAGVVTYLWPTPLLPSVALLCMPAEPESLLTTTYYYLLLLTPTPYSYSLLLLLTTTPYYYSLPLSRVGEPPRSKSPCRRRK